jgi:transcription elongation factor Elf1
MAQSFNCKRCHKVSKVSGIHYDTKTGSNYVSCEHCSAKNRLAQIPTSQGAPVLLEVVGIIEDDT